MTKNPEILPAGRQVRIASINSYMDEIKKDIIEKINSDFCANDAQLVIDLIKVLKDENKKLYSDRIIRCLVYASQGDLSKFDEAQQLAELDFRDLIVAAEYKNFEERLRNFNNPFDLEHLDLDK